MKQFVRSPHYEELGAGLTGKPHLLQVVVGPRQVGKTTLALQLFEHWRGTKHYDTADVLATPDTAWIEAQWKRIREDANGRKGEALLILDEVQKVPHWSSVVKRLFDEDRRARRSIRVVLLGSSALLMQKGLTESLAGRFELHRHYPWSYRECHEFFSLSLPEYLFFGGYPAGLALRDDEARWGRYMRDALVETVLSKDLLLLAPVRKPALLRQTFGIAVTHPAQILSYQKMLGSLQDAGNTTTIASYLTLLSQAFLLAPLERWSGSIVRRRGSQPKIVVLDNGIVSAMSGRSRAELQHDADTWGRMVENAVGAELFFLAEKHGGQLSYWRRRNEEVDYVLKIGGRLHAVEVKAGSLRAPPPSLLSFCRKEKGASATLLCPDSAAKFHNVRCVALERFFSDPSCLL